MKNIKNIIISIGFIVGIVILIGYLFNFLFNSNGYELNISSSNKSQIENLMNQESNSNIKKLILKPKLGDAELYIYTNRHEYEKILVEEGNPIQEYVMEKGIKQSAIYLTKIIVLIIILLILKRIYEKE